jgi:hypothetical protein
MKPAKRALCLLAIAIAMFLVTETNFGRTVQARTLVQNSATDASDTSQSKIARAMSAGPDDIARSARIIDTDAEGNTVVLRKGSNGFTCMPGNPRVVADPPLCADPASLQARLNTEVDKTAEMIALNITALTRLRYAAPPAFVALSAGMIINIASVVGISPETLNGVYGATKAYVIAFSLSLQHELADKGIRIQAELPGVTATDLWEIAGLPWQKLLASIVMSLEDMVDAALVGLDQGELVTIRSLHDGDEWTHFEAARRVRWQRIGNSTPAPRYGIGLPQSA